MPCEAATPKDGWRWEECRPSTLATSRVRVTPHPNGSQRRDSLPHTALGGSL